MTDDEIIKALECCVKDDIHEANNNVCLECPMNDDNACTFNLRKYTLDLINRQKAENEQLYKTLDYRAENIRELEQEIKRLRAKCEKRTQEKLQNARIYNENLKTAKAEAIKEFAERLKKESYERIDLTAYVEVSDIDNLVNEMVGE